MTSKIIPAIERFLNKVFINENSCWEWTGYKSKVGYGSIQINHYPVRVHRFIYEYYHGQICPDLTIDHLCRNRACVNPIHLEQVTQKENNARGNSPCAINSRKTHCIHGHEFTKENTYVRAKIYRRCKICNSNEYKKSRRLKEKVSVKV